MLGSNRRRTTSGPLAGNLELAGCDSVLINTHYLAEQVENFVRDWHSSTMNIQTVQNKLLGTAGTMVNNHEFFKGGTGLLIHADNAMAGDIRDLLNAHRRREQQCLLTMLTFKSNIQAVAES